MIKSVERWSIVKILPGPENKNLVKLVFIYIEIVQSNFFCRSILDRISLKSPAILVTAKTVSSKLNMV